MKKVKIKTYQGAFHPLLYALSLIFLLSLGLGCQKNDTNLGNRPSDQAQPIAPIYPTSSQTQDPSWQSGGTADFTPTNFQTFQTYVSQRPLNNPANFKFNVNLAVQGNGAYAGYIKIAYTDSGVYNESYQETGNQEVDVKSSPYHGMNDYDFNQWFNWQGSEVFHAFFQDQIGAIVLVIDQVIDLGDGGGSTGASGRIYFKNFKTARTGQSESKCWFLYKVHGVQPPYGCGTFFVGDSVKTTSGLYPGDGYQLLGTFQNLDKAKAFNQ